MFFKNGGYIIMRKSKFGWFPHFLWTESIDGLELIEFVPVNPKHKKMPPPIFKGYVRTKSSD